MGNGLFRWVLIVGMMLRAVVVRAESTVDGHPWPPDEKLYAPAGTEIAPGLKVGDTLDEKNADLARDLLPPEIVEHYRKGEYRNPIDSWPEGIIHRDRSFEEASEGNAGKYDIDPETGTIVEKASGRMNLTDIYGMPFPKIDPGDPQGGLKALWNSYVNWWTQGSYHMLAGIVWVMPKGLDRQSIQEVWFQYYLNQNPRYRRPNPQGFAWQSLSNATTPADLQGTASLTWRYVDPKKRDAVWAYVPALRRVRATSPNNRSDGLLGSDLSQDDGNFVDVKVEDFTWKTIGIRDGLRIAEPLSVHGHHNGLLRADGAIRDTGRGATPTAGYMVPGWTGLGWAPASDALFKRKFWVIEGRPRDRYYLYGRMELWIDTESATGAWSRKFGWKDELLSVYQVSAYLHYPLKRDDSDEVEWSWSNRHPWQAAEAVKLNRATLAGTRPDPDGPFDRRVTFNVDQLFSVATLSRFGK
ncbi:MAG: DUF1329 domain-containing protein [Candidatus Binatia bacterium]